MKQPRRQQAPTTFRIPRRLKKRLVLGFRRKAVAEKVERPRLSAAINSQWAAGQDNSAMVARVRRTHVPLRRNEAQRIARAAVHAFAFWPVIARGDAALAGLSLLLPGSTPSDWRAVYPWGCLATASLREAQWHRERLAAMEAQAKREEEARGEGMKDFIRATMHGDLPAWREYMEARANVAAIGDAG